MHSQFQKADKLSHQVIGAAIEVHRIMGDRLGGGTLIRNKTGYQGGSRRYQVFNTPIADHRQREARCWLNCPPDRSGRYQMVPTFRHIAAYLPSGFDMRSPVVSNEWAYVSAQSAFGLGPGMYEEFVHRYHCRIAELFTGKTVYYHGCECLDQKLGRACSVEAMIVIRATCQPIIRSTGPTYGRCPARRGRCGPCFADVVQNRRPTEQARWRRRATSKNCASAGSTGVSRRIRRGQTYAIDLNPRPCFDSLCSPLNGYIARETESQWRIGVTPLSHPCPTF